MVKRKILVIFIMFVFFLSSCENVDKENKKIQDETVILTENFDWLLGHWKRNNEKEGRETYEIWKKKNNTEYFGVGFTMVNNDTVKQEKMKLIKSKNNWILEVIVPHEAQAVIFEMTKADNEEFICENKELDFPKMIKYWKKGSKMNALVSGDEMEIFFEFERMDK